MDRHGVTESDGGGEAESSDMRSGGEAELREAEGVRQQASSDLTDTDGRSWFLRVREPGSGSKRGGTNGRSNQLRDCRSPAGCDQQFTGSDSAGVVRPTLGEQSEGAPIEPTEPACET